MFEVYSELMSAYRNFTLERVADGVWAALSAVNAGIVDLGDRTLIFDTFTTVGAARELRAAAEALTGRAPAYVINSHAHADHFNGNVVFEDALLVSSRVTRETMAVSGQAAMERMRAGMQGQFDAVRQQLARASDEGQRTRLQAQVEEYEEFFADYPKADDLRLPGLTYEREITLHGSKRSARLVTFGGAHSPCDAVLWLPGDKILFGGDLVIPGDNQILVHGRPEHWLPILEELEALGAETLVPGHRKIVPIGEGIAWARGYLGEIFRVAGALSAAGATPDTADTTDVPAGCNPASYRSNLRFLLQRVTESTVP